MSKNPIVVTDEMYLFWSGWPSQWYPAQFTVGDIQYNCCEQWMMAEKARQFGDTSTLKKILASNSPREQKKLGRSVKGFDEGKWNAVCRKVVYDGNLARFSQNKEHKALLLSTGNRTIVEASPLDRIWGIGRAPDDPLALDKKTWNGKNWLGEALMSVRHTLSTGI